MGTSRRTVFMGFGEHELGKMGGAWLMAGQSECQ